MKKLDSREPNFIRTISAFRSIITDRRKARRVSGETHRSCFKRSLLVHIVMAVLWRYYGLYSLENWHNFFGKGFWQNGTVDNGDCIGRESVFNKKHCHRQNVTSITPFHFYGYSNFSNFNNVHHLIIFIT